MWRAVCVRALSDMQRTHILQVTSINGDGMYELLFVKFLKSRGDISLEFRPGLWSRHWGAYAGFMHSLNAWEGQNLCPWSPGCFCSAVLLGSHKDTLIASFERVRKLLADVLVNASWAVTSQEGGKIVCRANVHNFAKLGSKHRFANLWCVCM